MLKKVRCIDANARQMAIISNRILQKSPKFAQQAYAKGALTVKNPRFNSDSVKAFYNINDFYNELGEIREDAKPVFAQILKDFGLKANATLADFAKFVSGVYK